MSARLARFPGSPLNHATKRPEPPASDGVADGLAEDESAAADNERQVENAIAITWRKSGPTLAFGIGIEHIRQMRPRKATIPTDTPDGFAARQDRAHATRPDETLTHLDQRGWLPALLDAPGRYMQGLLRPPLPLGNAHPDLDVIAALARRSRRANGYLSVDPELHAFECDAGVVTFATSGRTAFVVGGPHTGGDPKRIPALLSRFVEAARAHRYRRVLLFPILGSEREAAVHAGFDTVPTGVEAFIDLRRLDFRGKRFADLRQMRNRAHRRSDAVVVELSPTADRAAMEQIYGRWLAERPTAHQMTLVVGKPALDAPRGRRYFGVSASGVLQAFISIVPCFDGRGWGVDVMARPSGTPAGVMDFLISETALRLRDERAEVFSLGACPMALDGVAATPTHWLLRGIFWYLYRSYLGNKLFNFRSLHQYKIKFAPEWKTVYMAAWPRVSARALYVGCGMWGLFGPPWRIHVDPDKR